MIYVYHKEENAHLWFEVGVIWQVSHFGLP